MRHYLDTGVLPRTTPAQPSKSEERRPVQAVPARGKGSSPVASVKSGRTGEELQEIAVGRRVKGGLAANDDEASESGARHHAAPQAEATISIASLFGWGHDREKEEEGNDY